MNYHYVLRLGSMVYYMGDDTYGEGFYKIVKVGSNGIMPFGGSNDMYELNDIKSDIPKGFSVSRGSLIGLDECAMIAHATRKLLSS